MGKKKDKKLKEQRLHTIKMNGCEVAGKCKTKCCKKCPCFDLLKKVA